MNLNNKNIARYNLASAWARLFCRFFDLLTIVYILIGMYFALFFNSNEIKGWQIFLFSFITFILFFIQFIIVPFLTNGYTLFSKLFKIRIYSIFLKETFLSKKKIKYDKRFLIQIIKRETFLWLFPTLFFLIFGFFCLSSANINISKQLYSIIKGQMNNDFIVISGMIIFPIISITLFLPLMLIINIIIMSKKRALHDYFSNTVVIKMIDVNSDEPKDNKNIKSNKPTLKYGLPGEINAEVIKEIGE